MCDPDPRVTHSAGCWRWHPSCAVARLVVLAPLISAQQKKPCHGCCEEFAAILADVIGPPPEKRGTAS